MRHVALLSTVLGTVVAVLSGCTTIHTFPDHWPQFAIGEACPDISGSYKDEGERGDIKPGNYDPGKHLSKLINPQLSDVGDTIDIKQTPESIQFTVWNEGKVLTSLELKGENGIRCEHGTINYGETRGGASLGYWSAAIGRISISFSLLQDSSLAVRQSSAMAGILFLIPVVDGSNSWFRYTRRRLNDTVQR